MLILLTTRFDDQNKFRQKTTIFRCFFSTNKNRFFSRWFTNVLDSIPKKFSTKMTISRRFVSSKAIDSFVVDFTDELASMLNKFRRKIDTSSPQKQSILLLQISPTYLIRWPKQIFAEKQQAFAKKQQFFFHNTIESFSVDFTDVFDLMTNKLRRKSIITLRLNSTKKNYCLIDFTPIQLLDGSNSRREIFDEEKNSKFFFKKNRLLISTTPDHTIFSPNRNRNPKKNVSQKNKNQLFRVKTNEGRRNNDGGFGVMPHVRVSVNRFRKTKPNWCLNT